MNKSIKAAVFWLLTLYVQTDYCHFLLYFFSEAQRIIHQDYMDPTGMSGISGDQELTADRIRGFTVKAFTGFLTRCLDIKALGICRSCNVSGALHRFIKG